MEQTDKIIKKCLKFNRNEDHISELRFINVMHKLQVKNFKKIISSLRFGHRTALCILRDIHKQTSFLPLQNTAHRSDMDDLSRGKLKQLINALIK